MDNKEAEILEKEIENCIGGGNLYDDTGLIPGFVKKADAVFEAHGFREESFGVKQILIVTQNNLGDVILLSSMMRELRRNNPDAYITVIVSKAGYPYMRLCPYANEVHGSNIGFQQGNLYDDVQEIFEICREYLWAKKIDVCFIPQWSQVSLKTKLFCYISGARERIGFAEDGYSIYVKETNFDFGAENINVLYSKAVYTPAEIIQEAARDLYLITEAGCDIKELRSEMWLSNEAAQKASVIIKERSKNKIPVALCVGSAEMTRKYPIEKWIEVIRGLSDRAVFFIIGGPIEEEDGAAIERSVPKDAVCNLTGKLFVEESLAVIAAAELYLGNDTGMMHAAAASGRPIVAVFREAVDREEILTGVLSEYRRFEPWQIPYIALRPEHPLDDCGKSMIYGWCTVHDRPHCITQVKSEEVIEAVNTAFKDFLKK